VILTGPKKENIAQGELICKKHSSAKSKPATANIRLE
jgi:hypothetical protein